MKHIDTLAGEVFTDGQLPILVNANRQDYGRQRHDRPMHGHDSMCELLLCYRGFGVYHVNDFSYIIQEGDLIYYNCGELHEVVSSTDVEIGTYCFGFSNVQLKNLPVNHFIPMDSPHVRASQSMFPFLCNLSEQILQYNSGSPDEQLTGQLLGASLLMLAAQMPTTQQQTQVASAASQLTMHMKEYIDAHYTENLKLEDIAAALNCSVPYLSHTFKKATGYSPIQYVIRRRIGLAQTLLISTDYSATHIATLVGYDNPNYFNALFRKVVGTTPIRYRTNYLEALRGERNQL
ncbi:MAG: AraC family transcriptional regulator [Eubacteriales bacterium]|nr:AraC family transcriptional regulator [Eubacteriales bacterium]